MIKRLIIALSATLSLLSCAKEGAKCADVIFSIPGVESGSMTKVDAAGVSQALAAARPTETPVLEIQSKTKESRHYTAAVGQSVSLPLDTYTVTGSVVPSTGFNKIRLGTVYSSPAYKVEQEITVTDESSEFPLNAIYQCIALVIDSSASTAYSLVGTGGFEVPIQQFVYTGGIGVCFLVPSQASASYPLTVTPKDDANYEPVTYTLGYNKAGDVSVSFGKWYCFSPGAVDTSSGDMGIVFPEWEAGQQ